MSTKTKSRNKKTPVSLLLADLQLPFSQALLYRYGLIPAAADAVTVMRVTQKLIHIPVIAKQRASGMTLDASLGKLSKRELQRIAVKLLQQIKGEGVREYR